MHALARRRAFGGSSRLALGSCCGWQSDGAADVGFPLSLLALVWTRGLRMRVGGRTRRENQPSSASSSASATHDAKPSQCINLTSVVAPLLFRIHPDCMQMHSTAKALANEQAMKQLNQFLELASCAWQNDGQKTRQLVTSTLKQQQQQQPNRPRVRGVLTPAELRFPLEFYLPREAKPPADECASDVPTPMETAHMPLEKVNYIIQVPTALVRTTLTDNSSASDAEEGPSLLQLCWRQHTKVILRELYLMCGISLDEKNAATTWLSSPDEEIQQNLLERSRHAQSVSDHNREARKSLLRFEKNFHKDLSYEKNVVHRFTTGIEEGEMNQHKVLLDLLKQRVFVHGFDSDVTTTRTFNWFASLLLSNFMDLRLHALVWNRIVLLVMPQPKIREPALRRAGPSRLRQQQFMEKLAEANSLRWKAFENPDDELGLIIQILVPAKLHEFQTGDKQALKKLTAMQNELIEFLTEQMTSLETRMVQKRC